MTGCAWRVRLCSECTHGTQDVIRMWPLQVCCNCFLTWIWGRYSAQSYCCGHHTMCATHFAQCVGHNSHNVCKHQELVDTRDRLTAAEVQLREDHDTAAAKVPGCILRGCDTLVHFSRTDLEPFMLLQNARSCKDTHSVTPQCCLW